MDALVERYLAAGPPETLYDFLRVDHRQTRLTPRAGLRDEDPRAQARTD